MIHFTAEVSENAKIGTGTKIWNFSQVREKAEIGESCILGKNVYIDTNVKIGNNVKIQNNVNVYNGVIIEDDVFLGPSMTFTNDKLPRVENSDWQISETYVKKGASIGANATIICGITIGEYSMIGAGAVVTKDVPPFTLVVGNPARIVSKICRCGSKIEESATFCKKCEEVN